MLTNRQFFNFLRLFFLLFLLKPHLEGTSTIDPVSLGFEVQECKSPEQKYIEVHMIFHLEKGWKIQHPKDPSPMGVPPILGFKASENIRDMKVFWPDEIRGMVDEDRIPLHIYPQKLEDQSLLNMDIQFSVCQNECRYFNERFTVELPSLTEYRKGNVQASLVGNEVSLFWGVFLGLLGGLILNFMPCVLPVLSLKLMQFTKKHDVSDSILRNQLLATIGGIVFSFWILVFLVMGLRSLGQEVGWGLHFQQPSFVLFMCVVMLVFSANLMGIFEIRLPYFIQNHMSIKSRGLISNFFMGFLATLLATPCSAPFLGSALTYALSENDGVTFVIFTSMAIGFASPYIFLLISPKLVLLLPKPGKWMVWLRKFMGFGLLGTSIWLGGIWYEISYIGPQLSDVQQLEPGWESFSEKRISEYVKQGFGVFVDVTAKWCVTCVANKNLILSQAQVKDVLGGEKMKKMRADWTKPSEVISKYLNSHQRFGIPFNVYYSSRCPKGHVFSEILQVRELVEVIKNRC